jgi:hypothetical protein
VNTATVVLVCRNVLAEALIYFSAEKDVGVRIWLLMLATMGPSRSLSSRTLCQAGSFWNAVHRQCHGNSDSFAVGRQLASSDETDIV